MNNLGEWDVRHEFRRFISAWRTAKGGKLQFVQKYIKEGKYWSQELDYWLKSDRSTADCT